MSEYKLFQEIIALSQSKNWDQAKLEWMLDSIYCLYIGSKTPAFRRQFSTPRWRKIVA